MRSKEDYLNSLKDGRDVYYRGEKVESILDHPVLRVTALHAAKLFSLSRGYFDEDLKQEVSMYYRVPQTSEDLMERHKLIYETTMACNGIFNISQAIGSDALFSLKLTSKKIDGKHSTNYSARANKYHAYAKKNDLTLAVAQTDVKGDRAKRPSEQADPDLYLRVVDVTDDGIIVNGAKAHTTQAPVSDELIIVPTRAMTEEDKDYALSFALPANSKGLKFIVRPIDELEGNSSSVLSPKDYECETLTIFDTVHVPWERVFLFKEHEFAGTLALNFVTYHRFTALSYRAATSNLYLGATSLTSKANGTTKAPHIHNNLVNAIMYKELMRMSAIAAAHAPILDEGMAIPNPLYTNIGKLYSNQNFTRVLEGLIDTAGGIIATMPSQEDMDNPLENKYITKYLAGAAGGDERVRVLKIVKELVGSSLAGYMMTLMMHAEGSMEASRLGILRGYDVSEAENLVNGIL
jgi:4-hydroxybutyryl-CoA dehydratase/vinylacetyl-CoA-Delta-isomerase